MRRLQAKIVGGSLGAAIVLYAAIYLPMKSNYDQCGRVTLCTREGSDNG